MHPAPHFVRRSSFLWVGLVGLSASSSARAEEAEASAANPTGNSATIQGFEFGARAGYGFRLLNRTNLSSFSRVIPLWADLGYRFHPNWYIGAFFQYGIPADFDACRGPFPFPFSGIPIQCSGDHLRFGVNVHYHLRPDRKLDPWAGIGVGYEIAHSTLVTFPGRAGGDEFSYEFNGFELVNVQLGVDYRYDRAVGIGPFLAFTLAHYSNTFESGKLHAWLIVGARVVFDILVR